MRTQGTRSCAMLRCDVDIFALVDDVNGWRGLLLLSSFYFQSSFFPLIPHQNTLRKRNRSFKILYYIFYRRHNSAKMAPRSLISAIRPVASFSPITRRALSTTPRMLLKEDANRSPEELEQKKQEQLKEQKEGKGRWREDLASSGESNIAADKQNVKDHDSHIKNLQQEGAKKGEKGEL